MKDLHKLKHLAGETDIYLLDQLLKNRYKPRDILLDAGCGGGRNMHWFLKNKITIYGVDREETAIAQLKADNPSIPAKRFLTSPVENMPFQDNYFDHIISSAVLHFANDTRHFLQMVAELVRVLKPNGSLFIRMTSNIGLEHKVLEIKNGIYSLPDGSVRFLLTKNLLSQIIMHHHLLFIEPLKTVNVDDKRCMTTLMLAKDGIF